MFEQILELINTNGNRVTAIKITLVMDKATGNVNITDLMLQGGSIGTQWEPHPAEKKWTVDG